MSSTPPTRLASSWNAPRRRAYWDAVDGLASSSRLLPWGAVIAFACLAGAAVAFLPVALVLLLVTAAIGLVGVMAFRALFVPASTFPRAAVAEASQDARLRVPRLLFYAGAATIGFLTVRPAADLTLSDWFFFLSLGVAGLVVLLDRFRTDYWVPKVITIGVGIFAVGGLVSSFGALDGSASVAIVIRLLYLTLIWFWLAAVVLETREHVENAILFWVSSAALSSAGAVVQYFQGDVIPGGDVAWGRMTGFTPHTNNLAGLVATAFVPALMVAVDSRNELRKYVGVASVALIGAGILLSGSVGGFLTAAVSTVVWLSLRGVSPRLVLSFGAIVGAVFVLMSTSGSTLGPAPIERFQRVTSQEGAASGDEGSVFTRVDGYRDAWARIRENPFIGVGLDEESNTEVLDGHLVHNILVNPWFAAGLAGLIGIVTIIVGGFATARYVLRHAAAEDMKLASAILASYAAFVVFAMGEPILFVRYGWFPVAMLIAMRAQLLRAAVVDRAVVTERPARRVGRPLAQPRPATF